MKLQAEDSKTGKETGVEVGAEVSGCVAVTVGGGVSVGAGEGVMDFTVGCMDSDVTEGAPGVWDGDWERVVVSPCEQPAIRMDGIIVKRISFRRLDIIFLPGNSNESPRIAITSIRVLIKGNPKHTESRGRVGCHPG